MVAVTKGFGADAVVAAGRPAYDVGENYAAGAGGQGGRRSHRAPALRWHFLGAVQRNKVPALAPLVDCWQSVARLAEGEAIARRRPGADVLVEVDVAGAAGRNGCPPRPVPALVAALPTSAVGRAA